MPWLLLAFALGGGWLLVRQDAAERAPSGEPWPVGVTTVDASHAVTWAIANETDAGKLRAFAVQLAPYDLAAATALNVRAAVLEAPSGSPLGQYLPNQAGPSTQTASQVFSELPSYRR